jgi:phosphoglycolate phosphatase
MPITKKNRPVILFDLDGTLIDSTRAIVDTFYHSFDKMKYEHNFKDEDITPLIGYPLDIMYERLGVDRKYVWDFVSAYKERYRLISKEQTELLDFAQLCLEEAASFARLGVVTTKTGAYTKPLLEHFNIWNHFECLVGREDVQNPKPHAEPIVLALERMMIDKDLHDIWMIGDTKLDLISAKNAGVRSIGVLSGYGTHTELKEHTDIVYDNALEAVYYIKELNK